MPSAGVPNGEVAVPEAVRTVAGDDHVEVVWVNELGGLTFRLTGATRRFAKWAPSDSPLDLETEAERMRWAGRHAVVPTVLDLIQCDRGTVLVTAALPGESAVSARWKREPLVAVRAIGVGLRALHDVLPLDECPFDWSVERRLEVAHRRSETEADYRQRWDESHRTQSVGEALAVAADPPRVERAVVCHGDACSPNTLIADDGSWSGHVDLGDLGVADRWADLAVAAWSTEWNYGPGWSSQLLEAYGVDDDPERMSYYRLLWDLA